MIKPGRLIAGLFLLFWASMAGAQIRGEDDIVKTLFLEALRANPSKLSGQDAESSLYFTLNRFVDPGISKTYGELTEQQQRERLDEARTWIATQLQDSSVLPVDIVVSFPASLQLAKDGTVGLRISAPKRSAISGTLEELTIRAPLQTPPVLVRPVQPFDLGSLQPDGSVRAQLEELAQSRRGVMVVARITIREMGTVPQNGTATAGGVVAEVALHETTAVDRQLVAGDLIWRLPDPPTENAEIELTDIERVLRLQKQDGAYQDRMQNGNRPLINLLQWRALADVPLDEVISRRLSPDLFWQLYGEFTPRSLQDALIPPDRLGRDRRAFAPTLNDIDIRQAEDDVLRALWPQLRGALPNGPVPVASTASFSLSEYDFTRGGFSLSLRTNGWLVSGQYPILTGLPDFLTAPQEQATTLMDRMTAIDGAGRRNVTLYARFDLTSRQVDFPLEGPLQLPQIVPGFGLQMASLHAATQHPDIDSLMRNKLMDLDPTKYRGPERPIADQDELAQWAAIAEDPGARGEDLIAAAMAVADDPMILSQGMNRRGQVADPLAKAQEIAMPARLVLTGQMDLSKGASGWSATDFRWTYSSNESGLLAPDVELADTSILTGIQLTSEQDQALADIGGRVQYRATFQPVTAAMKRQNPVVYLQLTEVALFSSRKDQTGLPLVRIMLKSGDTPAEQEAATSPVQAPQRVVLDHDYLDLLLVAELGDELDDATMDRMLLDRLHRELRTQFDTDLPWGRFFDPMPQRLNRVERAALVPRFRIWQEARAAALPKDVVIAVANSYLQASCGVQVYAAPSQVNNFGPNSRALLETLNYAEVAQSVGATLAALDRVARNVTNRQPVLADRRLVEIGGRPIYGLLRTDRHPAASACIGNERLDAVTDGFDAAQSGTADAVAILHSPVLLPNESRLAAQTRHYARLREVTLQPPVDRAPAARSLGVLQIDLDVSDSVFYGQDALPQRHIPNPTGKPVRVPVAQVAAQSVAPAQALDIKGVTLASPPDVIEGVLVAHGAMQRRYSQGFTPELAPGSIQGHGTLPATQLVTQADMLIDNAAGEVLLSLTDARLEEGALGFGRLAEYNSAEVSAEGVLGAVLKKYGDPAFSEETRRGGRPLARYVWGFNPAISMPQCMPDLTNSVGRQMREVLTINSNEDRAFLTLAEALPWPGFGPVAQGAPDFSSCQPMMVVELGAYADKLRLVTWLLDPSRIQTLSWQEKAAPDKTELIEGAADIDL
ncbi:hypothetical protein PAF17_12885 [Paracoccus sp. Z330]|uniref:Uncharacterized protein n=1 Tax=Paracoccus onchidii TaxID=3017813 RepID=A0ABT4ZGF6_9RHOB|nr:hypothetical protein [Paracoccus onchidii]MDB6178392.1 hypothetical protein [Paracoccus onchidii]